MIAIHNPRDLSVEAKRFQSRLSAFTLEGVFGHVSCREKERTGKMSLPGPFSYVEATRCRDSNPPGFLR